MCAEPCGSELDTVGECEICGGPIDVDGDSTDICCHSPEECEICGWSPCDQSC